MLPRARSCEGRQRSSTTHSTRNTGKKDTSVFPIPTSCRRYLCTENDENVYSFSVILLVESFVETKQDKTKRSWTQNKHSASRCSTRQYLFWKRPGSHREQSFCVYALCSYAASCFAWGLIRLERKTRCSLFSANASWLNQYITSIRISNHRHLGFSQGTESILPLLRAAQSDNAPHHLPKVLEYFLWSLVPKTCGYLLRFLCYVPTFGLVMIKNVFLR